MIGRRLSHYEIVREIGSGAMGVVYLARDEHLHCDVALKVLPTGFLGDETARKRFQREARAIARRAHPNLVVVRDFDTQDEIDFLVMEYVEGSTLDVLLAGGRLPVDQICGIGSQLASGLAAAHAAGVIHRDVKPGNLKLTSDGVLKILDFGLAKIQPSVDETASTHPLTEPGHVVGTLPYLAPEILRGGAADARTDIYAAGVVLYEMAAGRRPHLSSDRSELARQILQQDPPPPSRWNHDLPAPVESIIVKAIDKNPARRYQSATELEVDLKRVTEGSKGHPIGVHQGRWRALQIAAALAVAAVLAFLFAHPISGLWPKSHSSTSLAVLPLEDHSSDASQEYFADGLTEELITRLAQIAGLDVISRTSAMAFKRSKLALPQIARRLNVRWVLTGSIVREHSRVRINAQLVDADVDQSRWADRYEGDLGDVLALQGEVAQAISREINVTLTPLESTRIEKPRPVVPAALEAYYQGLFQWNQRQGEGAGRAIKLFQEATELDPKFAKPYAALADAYGFLGTYSLVPQDVAYAAAKSAAERALEVDPDLGEAHASMASVKTEFEWDWAGAEREYRRAIELSPGYATAHEWFADYLSRMGRNDEAIVEIHRALELDPLSPPVRGMLGTVYYCGRQFDKAIEQYRKTLEANPDQILTRFYLGLAYLARKSYDQAVAEFELAVRSSGGVPLAQAGLGCAYGMAGRHADALRILKQLKELSTHATISPSFLALVCIGLGDKDQAFAFMEDGYRKRDSYLGHLKVIPIVDSLRPDPRFKDLLKRIGLDGEKVAT